MPGTINDKKSLMYCSHCLFQVDTDNDHVILGRNIHFFKVNKICLVLCDLLSTIFLRIMTGTAHNIYLFVDSNTGECYKKSCYVAASTINKPLHGKIDWTSASEIDLYNVARETSMALAEVTKNNVLLRREVNYIKIFVMQNKVENGRPQIFFDLKLAI